MPLKRRIVKANSHRITHEAVAAYRAGDYTALHRALNLPPWHESPLPLEITPLGVDQDEPPAYACSDTWYVAQELQAELEAASRA